MGEDAKMVALDSQGNPIQEDNYDELDAVLSGKDIPGDEFTGEDKPSEDGDEDIPTEDKDLPPKDKDTPEEAAKVDELPDDKEPPKDDKTPESVDTVDKAPEEDLRSLLREQRRQMAVMKAKLDRLGKRPAAPVAAEEDAEDDLDEEGNILKPKEPAPEKLSELETYQEELVRIGTDKKDHLDSIVAMMQLNPNYSDVEEVCTRDRFDDIFEAAATSMAEETGGDPVEAAMAIELHVWKKPNPYAYMYDLIKKHHPDFIETKDDASKSDTAPDAAKAAVDKKKVDKKPAEAPLSALDLSRGGGGKTQGEWTADKIDNLPEDELSKVPKEVYDMYLRGDLDK